MIYSISLKSLHVMVVLIPWRMIYPVGRKKYDKYINYYLRRDYFYISAKPYYLFQEKLANIHK